MPPSPRLRMSLYRLVQAVRGLHRGKDRIGGFPPTVTHLSTPSHPRTAVSTPLTIAVVIACSRPQGVAPAVAEWVYVGTRHRADVTYDLVDLAEQDLRNLDEPEPTSSGNYTRDRTRAWVERMAGYVGFVFVTAEYNRSRASSNALDFLYAEWSDKAAGIVDGPEGLPGRQPTRDTAADRAPGDLAADAELSDTSCEVTSDESGRYGPRSQGQGSVVSLDNDYIKVWGPRCGAD